MNFVLSPDGVRTAFGLSGVVYFPRYSDPNNQLNDAAALLLSSIGLPDTEWFMSKASLQADDYIHVSEWYAGKGTVPKECSDWLIIGMFADTTLALAPDTGTVYALSDSETELVYRVIHRDVESLVYALTKFQILQQGLEDGDDEDTEERVDALRTEITEFDPLPFEHQDSQWHLTFEEVIDGIW
ncbi:SUKH-4 family immunity protein [Streptomyces sp. NBC_00056]|uniref:SUKH-4 family immunity protein n=1 Tax=unclassified Streptomyces TaxID=2593676 RepID=UPI00224D84B7|nr:SUKH-4 family immunity protein [Streptomyces sp. NBC_00063]MCX5441047.1 SUKH-4 family immunity protein [Streptomyces sp. NBC_00063]